jgi:hypothetical protein
MKNPLFRFAVGMTLTLSLAACGDNPPKPVLPDGSHRVPVNVAPIVTPPAIPSGTATEAPTGTSGAHS